MPIHTIYGICNYQHGPARPTDMVQEVHRCSHLSDSHFMPPPTGLTIPKQPNLFTGIWLQESGVWLLRLGLFSGIWLLSK